MILAVKSLNLHDSFTEQFVLFLGKKLHLQTIAPKPNCDGVDFFALNIYTIINCNHEIPYLHDCLCFAWQQKGGTTVKVLAAESFDAGRLPPFDNYSIFDRLQNSRLLYVKITCSIELLDT